MADYRQIIVEAQAEFALKLLREISNGKTSSTIVSPASVAIALSMVYAGAKDETAKEMNKLLANGASEEKVHQYFGYLVGSINNSHHKHYTLKLANKVYVKEGLSILDEFKSTINEHYRGLFESVDFEQKQEIAKEINHFVEQATHGKIKDIVGPDSFNGLTRLVLINAIYFKGTWVDQFNAALTQKKIFHVHENQEKQLDMMHKTAKFIYSETQTYQVLGIPYVGAEIACFVMYVDGRGCQPEHTHQAFMFILLPKERYGLDQVLANLSGKELLNLVQMRAERKVEVVLPKFKLEFTNDLKSPLINLGIARAFGDDAQLEGIAKEKPLQIDQVIQKVFIEVNEEGTKAAAATATAVASFYLGCPSDCPTPPPRFIADHPFAFILSYGPDNPPLFIGTFYG